MQTTVQRRSSKRSDFPGTTPLNSKPLSSASPFVKWAGGKTQLLPELRKYVPPRFGTYIEPFAGGAALFFDLLPARAILSDTNADLINAYRVIQSDSEGLIQTLSSYRHDEKFFYDLRDLHPESLSPIEQAARFLYLNKCCFNGLYRVNLKGEFNVPFGRYVNPTICDAPKLRAASEALKNVTLLNAGYQEVLREHAQKGDFVYIDPPYAPVSKYSDFNRYTKEKFADRDQEEVRDMIVDLKRKGVFVLASNSHCALTLELYQDCEVHIVDASRKISTRSTGRSGLKELIIL